MNKNPLWILVVLLSLCLAFTFGFFFFTPEIYEQLNIKGILFVSLFGYLSIAAYAIFRTNKDLHKGEDFTKLTDKDKYLDLLEDTMELENKAIYIAHIAKKNTEKLSAIGKQLFPKDKA